jgi:FKBP-type peptidyl-prolyl cis-trans isomerase
MPLFMARAGLAEGISLMKTSEIRRLWIPARLVYLQPAADAKDLVIDVRLVSIARDEKEDVFPSEMADWERANRAPRDLASPPKSAQTTPSGLKFRVLKSGKHKADASPTGETVSFSYKAWTKDGKLLDHAIVGEVHHGRDANNGAPPSLLIAGLAEALRLMRPGNQYRFWIPAELAHGNEPRVPNVPAGPIVVNIELTDP